MDMVKAGDRVKVKCCDSEFCRMNGVGVVMNVTRRGVVSVQLDGREDISGPYHPGEWQREE
jgi:hypothetical protein